ncbi:hypothetical protein GS966_13645 [Rhodococcus hoagii]|nr:hypothetical protein [Prescottella equi]
MAASPSDFCWFVGPSTACSSADRSRSYGGSARRAAARPDWGTTTNRGAFEQQRWKNAIAHLADYVTVHGHTRVPHRLTCSDGFRLGLWVTTRRVDRRHSRQSLTPDRITELDNLGFDWGTTRTKR